MKHVVIIGQSGAGKSSLVNMLCPEAKANVSNDAESCTTREIRYPCQFDNRQYTVHDTVGIREGTGWVFKFWPPRFSKREPEETPRLKRYLKELMDKGELHLLIYCMSGIRYRKPSHADNYEIFKSFVGPSVPVVVVVTSVDYSDDSERRNWWSRNAQVVKKFDGKHYACVTTLPGTAGYATSCKDVKTLIRSVLP